MGSRSQTPSDISTVATNVESRQQNQKSASHKSPARKKKRKRPTVCETCIILVLGLLIVILCRLLRMYMQDSFTSVVGPAYTPFECDPVDIGPGLQDCGKCRMKGQILAVGGNFSEIFKSTTILRQLRKNRILQLFRFNVSFESKKTVYVNFFLLTPKVAHASSVEVKRSLVTGRYIGQCGGFDAEQKNIPQIFDEALDWTTSALADQKSHVLKNQDHKVHFTVELKTSVQENMDQASTIDYHLRANETAEPVVCAKFRSKYFTNLIEKMRVHIYSEDDSAFISRPEITVERKCFMVRKRFGYLY